MNRSMMPQQIMAYNQGGIASFIPQQTQIMGQPHRLAYVNPQEEQMMLNAGGAGLPGPGGIPAYWTLTEPSTWGDGQGYEGVGNFNASDNNNAATTNNNDDNNYTDTSSLAGISNASGVNYTGNDDNDQRVGFLDSLAMGLGFKDKTPAYYNTTAQTIAANQGQTAAQNYLQGLADDDKISDSSLGIFSDAASQVDFNPTVQSNDDNNNVVDSVTDGTVTDDTVDGEEEIQYTQMKPFYGGYQPSTVASTLVPSQLTRPTGSNPRLDPIYPSAFTSPQALTNPNIDPSTNLLQTAPLSSQQSFASGMPEINPLTGLPQTASTNSGGQFNSLAELDAFQQQYPSANLMGEYQRLRALEGGIPAVAKLPNRGVASIFGNEQAPQYMYQGIMG
jgi:hypothetical protein